jgi:hypothetical protein
MGDLNTPLSPIDKSSKQKVNKEILELNHTIDQMDLVDVYRLFHPTSAQYTFFSASHGSVPTIPTLIQHSTGLPSQSNWARRRNKRNINR